MTAVRQPPQNPGGPDPTLCSRTEVAIGRPRAVIDTKLSEAGLHSGPAPEVLAGVSTASADVEDWRISPACVLGCRLNPSHAHRIDDEVAYSFPFNKRYRELLQSMPYDPIVWYKEGVILASVGCAPDGAR